MLGTFWISELRRDKTTYIRIYTRAAYYFCFPDIKMLSAFQNLYFAGRITCSERRISVRYIRKLTRTSYTLGGLGIAELSSTYSLLTDVTTSVQM